MTPAEKAAANKPPRKNSVVPPNRCPRKYPWVCLLRALRHSLKLSMRDVTSGVGLSMACLSVIELGADPQLTTARKLATFFGKSVEELWPSLRSKA